MLPQTSHSPKSRAEQGHKGSGIRGDGRVDLSPTLGSICVWIEFVQPWRISHSGKIKCGS